MITSTFTTDLEGWVTNNGTETYSTDGNPDGSIRGVEGGNGDWYFQAPSAYLGDLSSYYGGSLSFDLRQDGDTSQFDGADVILTGGGMTIALDDGPNPGTDWTHYEISLALGGGWHVGSLGGPIATEAEILTVLSDLTEMSIRGEFVGGVTNDASNLDNVVVSSEPPPPPVFQGATVQSTFDTGLEGWSFIADVQDFNWVSSGGNPGGYVEAVDYASGEVWYFVAPDQYLGDKSGFSGGTLSFDLEQSSTSSQFDDDDVVIQGGGMTIVLGTASHPGLDWTHYDVSLSTASDWHIGSLSGAVATQAEIDQVLGDITALHIRGEFVNGSDTGGLDNVVMQAPGGNVRLLSDATTGTLLSSHTTLADALAAAGTGNAILVEDAAGVSSYSYIIGVDGLTIISDQALGTQFEMLDGLTSLTLGGTAGFRVGGNTADNQLTGNDGNNFINAWTGNDIVLGGAGNDRLLGETGNDTLDGGAGRDRLVGGTGDDSMSGGTEQDTMLGGSGNDTMDGDDGNDVLRGNGDHDLEHGGAGDDIVIGGTGRDTLFGNGGMDTLRGNGGFDTVDGGNGDDFVAGGAQADLVLGGAGNDTLSAGGGFDTIDGGIGNDQLTGNFNADQFLFVDGHGNDTITDFEATNNAERIDLSGISAITSLADLDLASASSGAATQVGADVVIDTGDGGSITLLGVSLGDLDANDFTF